MQVFTQPEDRILSAKILDQASFCVKNRVKTFSDFADPIRMGKIHHILKEHGYGMTGKIGLWGGYEDAERLMLGFAPEQEELLQSDFPISPVKISYNARFSKAIAHRDYLGAVLGMGIDRSRIGDILPDEGFAIMLVSQEIAAFVMGNLAKVGNTPVKAEIAGNVWVGAKEPREMRITLPSLRLDAVLSGAFNISRSKAADLIEGDKAFVNYAPSPAAAKAVAPGDLISLRGIGRIRIGEVTGKTKKDRLAVTIYKY